MTTRNIINLPAHPDIPDVVRKAKVSQASNNYDGNCVTIEYRLLHYVDGVEVFYLPKSVQLIGDNADRVNPLTGDKLEADGDGNYPEGSVPEFDYLWYLVNTVKLYTQVELEDTYILRQINTVNRKAYNRAVPL